MWKRLFGKRGESDEARAARQESDVHALDTPGDPRGGLQSEEYRHARPEDVVEEGDVAMGGPGGAPVDEVSAEERRERDRPDESV
ncbi:MAG TPA: hypothetical protein VFU64_08235 [Gaiellaceae bacterium]|nr:hypothetical protein [Gaiellaceae bacterium]